MTVRMILVMSALFCCGADMTPALGQEAILPHGDPRLRGTESDKAAREQLRDSRLKQQGQGSHYRIEGEPQPSAGPRDPTTDQDNLARQDTGMADPSVNPGQAAGMQRVQGRVIQSEADTHVVRQLNGPDATLVVDARTAGDKDLHPGDVITGFVTAQGRAVVIKKEQPEPTER